MDSSRNGLLSTLLMTLPLIAVPAMALLRPPGQNSGVSTNALEAGEDPSDDWLDSDLIEEDSAESDNAPLFDEAEPKAKSSRSKKKASEPDFDDIFESNESNSAETGLSSSSRSKSKKKSASQSKSTGDDEPEGNTLEDPFISGESGERGKSQRGSSSESDGRDGTEEGLFEEVPADDPKLSNGPRADEVVRQLTSLGAVRTKWFEAGDRYPVGLAVYFRGRNDDEQIRFEAVGQTRDECANDVLKQVEGWQSSSHPE